MLLPYLSYQLGEPFGGLSGVAPGGGGGGDPGCDCTLDAAYDYTGGGAGRTITVDAGAVELYLDGISTGLADAAIALLLANRTAALSVAPVQRSPVHALEGQYWDGTASREAQMGWQLEPRNTAGPHRLHTVRNINEAGWASVGYVDSTGVHGFADIGGADPAAPENGQLWYRSDTGLRLRHGGSTITLGAGGGGGNVVDTLQQTYDVAAATITKAAAKPIALTDTQTDGSHALTVSKTPGSAAGGNAIDVVLNVNASGAGLKITHDGLAVETVHGLGLWLYNSTPAAVGAQQVSPDLKLTGHGWKTDATAASQQHDWVLRVFPTQGAAASTSAISIRHRIDAAAYATIAQITSAGQFVGAAGSATSPTLGFTSTSGTNLGLFSPSTSTLALAIGGAEVLRVAAAQMTSPDGSTSAPFYSFTGATGLGMYRATNALGLRAVSQVDFNINGTLAASVSGSSISPNATATIALGQSGLRFTSLFAQAADLSQAVSAGTTSLPALKVSGAAHTTQTAGAELVDIDFALNRTVQHATGAVATQRSTVFRAPTYSFVGASVITDAATLAITGAPVPGTNATITNPYALWVQAGKSKFGGAIEAVGSGDGATPAFGVGTEGIDKIAATSISAVVGGFERARFDANGMILLGGLFFNVSENTTKIYRSGANEIAIDLSGTERFKLAAAGAVFGRSVRTTPVALTDGATVTPDLATSNQFTWTAAGSRTLANPSNIVAGMQWQIDFTQDGTGGRTITWGTSYVTGNGGTMSSVQPESGANRVTVFTFKAITTTKIAVLKSDWY